jgi:hypothetical protein
MSVTPGIVTFNAAAFIQAFPAFSSVNPAQLASNFAFATLQLDNSLCSVVQDVNVRAALLNLLTAHITALLNGENGDAAPSTVGRISSATQGSVNVQTEFDAKTFSEAYYAQTKYGLQFWQSTARFRTARYVPPGCDFGGGSPWNAWPQ